MSVPDENPAPRWTEEADEHGCVRFFCEGDMFAYFSDINGSDIRAMRRLVGEANEVDDLRSRLGRATEALELDGMEAESIRVALRGIASDIQTIVLLNLDDIGKLP